MKLILAVLLCLGLTVSCSDNQKSDLKTGEEIRIEQLQTHLNYIKEDVVKFRKTFSKGELRINQSPSTGEMSKEEERIYENKKTEFRISKKIILFDIDSLIKRIKAEKKLAQEKEVTKIIPILDDLLAQVEALKKDFE